MRLEIREIKLKNVFTIHSFKTLLSTTCVGAVLVGYRNDDGDLLGSKYPGHF